MALGLALGVGRTLGQRPLGIDVSSYQGGSINWTSVKDSGISFAWAKAAEGKPGEGITVPDPDFAVNEANAKAAGMPIGAYYFAHPDLDTGTAGADAEAAYFWSVVSNYVKAGGAYLQPMLDIETAPPNGTTQAQLSSWINEWCNDVVSYGATNGVYLHPVVYTYISYANTWINSSVTQWPLWMANPGGNPQSGGPSSTAPWSTWVLWQYGQADISGITTGVVDEDVYNGTLSQMMTALIVTNILNVPTITNQPANLTIYQGQNAIFSVGATGAGKLAYQWQFDGTNIGGATNTNYVIPGAQIANAGNYSVTVSNANGPTTSYLAYLGVIPPLTNGPGSVVIPAGMVNWWPGNGNTKDIYAGDEGVPTGGFQFGPGLAGESFQFDGSTSFLTVSNGPASIPPPWTACFWVNRQDTPQTSATLISDGTNTLKLEQYDGTHQVGITKAGATDWTFSPSYIAPAGTWTHLAFIATTNGSPTTTLYVNGVLQGTIATNLPLGRTTIGADYFSAVGSYLDFLNGNVGDIALFNVALTPAQIQAIYAAGASGFVRQPAFLNYFYAPSNGRFTLDFEGFTGKNITIYASSNLVTWTALVTDLMPNGTNQYVDTTAHLSQFKFYRAVSP